MKQFVRDTLLDKVIIASDIFSNQAAWRAISLDRELKTFFESLYPRTGKKKAIVAVARKLIGRIRAAFRQGELYQLNYQNLVTEVS